MYEPCASGVSFNDKIDILSNLGELGNDEDGEEMELDLTLSRNDVFACMAPLAQKAIDICLALLERNNLSGKDLHSILLVGGPTYSPLIRDMLKERLGAKVDTSINPMTAVSVGAALYASTLKCETGDIPAGVIAAGVPCKIIRKITDDDIFEDMHYKL